MRQLFFLFFFFFKFPRSLGHSARVYSVPCSWQRVNLSREKDKCILFLCFSANQFCACRVGRKKKGERNGGRTVLRIYAQFYFFLARCNVAQNPSDSTSVYFFLFFSTPLLPILFLLFRVIGKGNDFCSIL